MTFTLTLFRHAKSSWDDAVPRDFDRPLNTRGEKAAFIMGIWAKRNGLTFDHVVASPAVRVIETIDQFVQGTGERIEPNWDRRIYLASSATLMDVLRDQSDAHKNLLMVGHNPGLEDLVFDFLRAVSHQLKTRFRTTGVLPFYYWHFKTAPEFLSLCMKFHESTIRKYVSYCWE